VTTKKAYLVLEDGSVYEGEAFGSQTEAYGEVVFDTSMAGYQEALTDPSFAGEIVVLTYPIVGNYGINAEDFESARIQVAGLVVRQECTRPSHEQSRSTLGEFLTSQGVPGISGIDTRAITRRLRTQGVMMGMLCHEAPEEALARLPEFPRYDEQDFVRQVTIQEAWPYSPEVERERNESRFLLATSGSQAELSNHPQGRPGKPSLPSPEVKYRIVVSDCGLKYNILRLLRTRGCEAIAVPASMSAEEILALEPDGIILSPGPGDPTHLDYVVEAVRGLVGKVPIFGICLGSQVVAKAFGGDTFKLKFGHRGANHPVRDLATGRVHITAQNHGYVVDPDTLPPELEVSHVNLNDGTVEGLRHRGLPIMTIQYHSEASPGPRDNEYMFDRFLEMVDANRSENAWRQR